jgi:phosphatidylglycerophosphatase A
VPGRSFTLRVATAGGAGYAPVAPGTAGSAVGVVLYLLLADLGAPLFGVTLLGLAFLGVWASDEAERAFGQKDDGRIVIDEVVGQLLTLAPLVALAPPSLLRSPPWLFAGFLLFRVLDIWKPGPVAWAERSFAGGTGVMMDDIFAGILGGLILSVAVLWVGP